MPAQRDGRRVMYSSRPNRMRRLLSGWSTLRNSWNTPTPSSLMTPLPSSPSPDMKMSQPWPSTSMRLNCGAGWRMTRRFRRDMGLYGLLLGNQGDADDAEFLRREILRPTEDFQFGLSGRISGYLLLSGEEGLEVIEENKLRNLDADFSETYAAMRSLQFMWTYSDGEISKERLRAAMRILLDRPELTDIVIIDLARWQDWSIAGDLMEMYGAEAYNLPSIKRAIVRYFLVAKRATGEDDSTETPDHVLFAEACLEKLRETDPDTVMAAERFFFLN